MAEAKRIPPLDARVYGGKGVSLAPAEPHERISLRAEEEAVSALGNAIGLKLPTKPNKSETKGDISALWIGPDEWLIIGDEGADLEEKLNGVKKGLFSVVSINHRNTAILVSGENALDALNAGCPRDLSIEAFPIGNCSRTIMGKAEIVLWRIDKKTFHVECWRSFSDYVWKHLVDAAALL